MPQPEGCIHISRISVWSMILVCCVLCVGCAKKNKEPDRTYNVGHALEVYRQRYTDVPLPVGSQLLGGCDAPKESNEFSTHFLMYQTILSKQQVILFYQGELERLGWDITNLSNECEGLFVCGKRGKTCSVSVRDCHTSSGKLTRGARINLFLHRGDSDQYGRNAFLYDNGPHKDMLMSDALEESTQIC